MTGMTPADIGRLVGVDDVRLSPDASLVAFTVGTVDLDANEYRKAVWLGPTDGSVEPVPFTAGDTVDGAPRWSPDGRRLAFVSKRAGDDPGVTIKVAPVGGGGEVRTVATWDDDVDDLAWSPDGRLIAFGGRLPDPERLGKDAKDQPPRRLTRLFFDLDTVGWLATRPRRLFVVPADGTAKPMPLGADDPCDPDTSGLGWTPDGKALVHAGARHETWDLDLLNDLWLAPLDGGPPRRLTATDTTWAKPSVSPDGQVVAAMWFGDPWEVHHGRLAVLDLATGAWRSLTDDLDRPADPFGVAARPIWDGDELVFAAEDRGNVHAYRAAADGSSPPRPVIAGDRTVVALDGRAGVTAAAVTTLDALPEVVVVDPTGGERRLTALGAPFAAAVELAEAERFTAVSADGTEVDAWYLPPVGAEPGRAYPTLLNVHGGPFTQYGHKFFDEFHIQSGAGFGVVFSNPRGSSGYGEAWGQAIAWPQHPVHPGSGWGGVDADDVLAVLDEAIRRFPSVDGARVGVLGGSYGGYMASWLAARRPERWRAACSERAVNDIVMLDGVSDIATGFRSWTGISHLEHPAPLAERSPLTYVRDLDVPMLIVHSEGDRRCPVDQADALFTALRMLRRPVEYLRFPAESHELSRSGSPRHRVARAEAILAWFSRWLAG